MARLAAAWPPPSEPFIPQKRFSVPFRELPSASNRHRSFKVVYPASEQSAPAAFGLF
ncbi:hypothetical protein N8T08_002798 [Aspergillus melleus]|uniref:Uncharacterized protein n=1 Tax=Aspergillus melleus TaxID=138277 RepID=A0ACC3B922_9EURO|nr:hypothetical protein N8T08_002798 [Aspergillus melleus]